MSVPNILSMIVWENFKTEIVYILKISVKSVFLCTVTCQQDLITMFTWCKQGAWVVSMNYFKDSGIYFHLFTWAN